ncbi:MAG: ROK family protein [Phycisphaera sp.]|nr:ROK family protein [Phycisphaera sp.]
MPKNDKAYVGVDLGGTNISAGVLSGDNRLLSRDKNKTKASEGPEKVLSRIVKTIYDALDDAKLSVADIGGVGIGAPGTINMETGVVSNAVNLCWDTFDIGPRLSKELGGVGVTIDNDVNVGAWGEYVLGASQGYDDNLAVFVGTGIGGGFVINGKLYHGHFQTAGEIGQTILMPEGGIGRQKLEQFSSRTAVVNLIKSLILSNHPSKIREITDGDLDNIRSKVLAKAVADEDALAMRVIRESATFVGISIANAVTLLSLPCVVIGGGLTEALGSVYVKWVKDAFRAAVHPPTLSECKIVASKLGDDAGVIGAALLARDRLG